MWIFLLQFCKFSAILWSNLFRILDFDRNNLFTHFCFSELLILKEKISSRIFKKYWNNTVQDSCTKKLQCCTRCRKSHFFFDSPCIAYMYIIYIHVFCVEIYKHEFHILRWQQISLIMNNFTTLLRSTTFLIKELSFWHTL